MNNSNEWNFFKKVTSAPERNNMKQNRKKGL